MDSVKRKKKSDKAKEKFEKCGKYNCKHIRVKESCKEDKKNDK